MQTSEILWITGRVLLGSPFIIGGIRHCFIVPILTGAVAARGVPVPRLLLITATAFQIVAGAALIAGLYVFWAAVGLIAFTLVGSVVMMDFWNKDGMQRITDVNAWQANAGIVGGLLILVAQAL